MRLALGRGVVLAAALLGCRPPAPPSSGFTLLFFGRSPAASLGGFDAGFIKSVADIITLINKINSLSNSGADNSFASSS